MIKASTNNANISSKEHFVQESLPVEAAVQHPC